LIEILFLVLLFLALFLSSSDKKNQYGQTSLTENGVEVKSKTEKHTSDYFSSNNIRYEYERKIRIKGRTLHPDWYLPDYNVYVEYWGLVDADDPRIKSQYVKNMKRKMAQYHSQGLKFISIYPRNMTNLDWIFRKKLENETGITLQNTNHLKNN